MGWSVRKSIKLGSGVRMNLSKSGIGFSAGVKGFRVSTGPRGSYINMGRGGVYYRHKISGPYGLPAGDSDSTRSTQPLPSSQIPTAHAGQLVSQTSQETLEQINACAKQPQHAWIALVAGFLFTSVLANISGWLVPGALIATWLFYQVLREQDNRRHHHPLHYQLEEAASQWWDEINAALSALGRSRRLWSIQNVESTDDWKRNGGSSAIIDRCAAHIGHWKPPHIQTNVLPVCLSLGNQILYFFPDRIYVFMPGQNAYGAVEYLDLFMACEPVPYLEQETVPDDAPIIGSGWRYVNKNGGPDLRYADNPPIPIVTYAFVALQSASGLDAVLQASSVDAASRFVKSFNAAVLKMPTTNEAYAMRVCSGCGKEVSVTASACDNCGRRGHTPVTSAAPTVRAAEAVYERPSNALPIAALVVAGLAIWMGLLFGYRREAGAPMPGRVSEDATETYDPPRYPSGPLQRADGSFYPMAGVDFPADAQHPPGTVIRENYPTPAPPHPPAWTAPPVSPRLRPGRARPARDRYAEFEQLRGLSHGAHAASAPPPSATGRFSRTTPATPQYPAFTGTSGGPPPPGPPRQGGRFGGGAFGR